MLDTDWSDYVPDIHHIDDHIVMLTDSSLLSIIRVQGYPFQLEPMRVRNLRQKQFNELFKNVADSNLTIAVHLVQHDQPPARGLRRYGSNFLHTLFAKHETHCLDGRAMAQEWYLTLMVRPKMALLRRKKKPAVLKHLLVQLRKCVRTAVSYLDQCDAHLLGYRNDDEGVLRSEIGEARRLILYGRWHPVPVENAPLASSIYNERVICGTRACRIDHVGRPRYAKTIAFKDYPGKARIGQFTNLLHVSAPFVMTHIFSCHSRAKTETNIYFRQSRMGNALDPRKEAVGDLGEALEAVESGDVVRGSHNFSVTVFGDNFDQLYRAMGQAGNAIVKGGAQPIEEDSNAFAAFWAQLPGNPDYMQGRAGRIDTNNFSTLANFDGFPRGEVSGRWGPASFRFLTTANTVFDWCPHAPGTDVGHTMFIGRVGSGKSLLMNLLACSLEPVMRPSGGTIVMFDRDRVAEPMIRARGGRYVPVKAGEPSGLAPLKAFADTPGNRNFLETWIAGLMMLDGQGPLKNETIRRLSRGVARQMRMPPEKRSFIALRAFLGFDKEGGDGERLDRWCRGAPLGWMFDNAQDEIALDSFLVGIDLTRVLEHFACPAVGAYLVYRIRELLDGRPVGVVADECRYYLLNPLFRPIIETFAIDLRKKEGFLWLATQQPEHILDSEIGSSLLSQCISRFIFASRDANPESYARLGFTGSMYKALTEEMPTLPYRNVMLQRETGSVILRTDLENMEDEVRLLSGREGDIRRIPDVLRETGGDPDRFVEGFIRRETSVAREAYFVD